MAVQIYDPFPKYLQIRGIVLHRLRSLKVGDPLPTEEDLAAQFQVSRETIREALQALTEDGIIARKPRRGTWLAKQPADAIDDRLTGPFEGLATEGKVEIRSASDGVVAAVPDVAGALRVSAGEKVYEFRRLRFYDGQPLVMFQALFPLEIGKKIARLDLGGGLFVPVLRKIVDSDVHEAYQRIEALAADRSLAAALDVASGAPLLLVNRVFVDPNGRPVVLFKSHYRADRYIYTVRLPKPPNLRQRASKRPRRGRRPSP